MSFIFRAAAAWTIAFFLALTTLPATDAWAVVDRQIALVIGNNAYQNTAKLTNPVNDATDLAVALRRLGFEVFEGHDLDKRATDQLIQKFIAALAGARVGLFFYAGHGLEVAGQNYLIPIDAQLNTASALDFEAVRISIIHSAMERETKTNIILLDACRDNPLARNLASSLGTRGITVGTGLATMEAGEGTLISFSTMPGAVAYDGKGRNSPYTEALLNHLGTPGQDISSMLIDVRNDVMKATDRRQVPWEHSALTSRFFFLNDQSASARTPTFDQQIDISWWDSVKGSKSPETLQTYLDRFPNGQFASLARQMIRDLTAESTTKTKADQTKAAADKAAADKAAADKAAADKAAAEKAAAERAKPDETKVATLEKSDTTRSASRLDKAEAERTIRLIKRGEQLLADGNVAAARESFRIAAEAGNAEAAIAMGSTYDPNQFAKYNIRGMKPDKEMAKKWYLRGVDLGSKDAIDLLEQLDKT